MNLKITAIILLILLILLGCKTKEMPAPALTLDLGKPDYSKFQVISLDGEGECIGNEADPCLAEAQFRVTEPVTANPLKLIEISSPVKEIKGYNKQMKFEPGETYTLKYEVLKIDPADVISWKFAGKE